MTYVGCFVLKSVLSCSSLIPQADWRGIKSHMRSSRMVPGISAEEILHWRGLNEVYCGLSLGFVVWLFCLLGSSCNRYKRNCARYASIITNGMSKEKSTILNLHCPLT